MSVFESPICTGQKWTVVLSKPWICSKKFKESMFGEKRGSNDKMEFSVASTVA